MNFMLQERSVNIMEKEHTMTALLMKRRILPEWGRKSVAAVSTVAIFGGAVLTWWYLVIWPLGIQR
jgi:hypothetical protein